MTNRNAVKLLFITFPQTDVSKIEFRDKILAFKPDFYHIVQETHENGGFHLHAAIRLTKPMTKKHILSQFKEMYPNDYKRIDVQPTRSIKHSLQYLSKEDNNPLTTGEYNDNRDIRKNVLNKYAQEYGFKDIDALVIDTQRNRQEIDSLVLKLGKMEAEGKIKYDDLDYDICKILKKLFVKNVISKDDMTKIYKQFKIKGEEAHATGGSLVITEPPPKDDKMTN